VLRLQVTRLVRGRQLRLGAIAVTFVVLAVLGARFAGQSSDPAVVLVQAERWGFFTLLVFLLPFLFNAGAIGEEVERRTFSYLASRPAGRIAVTLGKYLAGVGLAFGLLAGGLLLLHVVTFATDPTLLFERLPATLQTLAGLLLLVTFYGAVCLFWGAVAPEAAGIIAILHLGVLEFGFVWLPTYFRLVSMNYLGRQLAGLSKGGIMASSVPDVPPAIAAAVLLVVSALTMTVAAVVVRMSEYRYAQA
jgi:hypothetical protein